MEEQEAKPVKRFPDRLVSYKELALVAGRPPTKINADKLYELAQTLLPDETIASILGVSVHTLTRKFSKVMQAGRDERKKTLLSTMWYKALVEKDTKMLIWLSKQYLNHKETWPDMQQNTQINVFTADVPK